MVQGSCAFARVFATLGPKYALSNLMIQLNKKVLNKTLKREFLFIISMGFYCIAFLNSFVSCFRWGLSFYS